MTTDVTVRLFAAAAAAAGTTELVLPATSLLDLRGSLAPSVGAVLDRCSFLVDGLVAHGDVPLRAGATVDVLPPFAGG
ncbi:MAG: molybdopterin synthase sulfur carrier subunit [Frankiales bacterium]|jgi:molybdopterin synthase sulfur carrier subunit|nr:molybdopterin synthase sulfur carrier subunit [Frankiales bacterium]